MNNVNIKMNTNTVTNSTPLEILYWKSQEIHNKLFSLEHSMRKLASQGKCSKRTQSKYLFLLDELREINAEMIMLEN